MRLVGTSGRPSDIQVSANFLAEQKALRERRAARFEGEAARPPPLPPPKILAHPGGKIVTSDPLEKLQSLLSRQSSPPTAAQRAALERLALAKSAKSTPRRASIPLRRAPQLRLVPWARYTCSVTAFIYRRRRRLLRKSMIAILKG